MYTLYIPWLLPETLLRQLFQQLLGYAEDDARMTGTMPAGGKRVQKNHSPRHCHRRSIFIQPWINHFYRDNIGMYQISRGERWKIRVVAVGLERTVLPTIDSPSLVSNVYIYIFIYTVYLHTMMMAITTMRQTSSRASVLPEVPRKEKCTQCRVTHTLYVPASPARLLIVTPPLGF